MKPINGMRHEQYLAQQIAHDAEFGAVYDEARFEARLALALADLRERRGMSQRDLAEVTGIKQPMIARLERGGQTPTVMTLLKLTHALRATVEFGPDGEIIVHFTDAETPRDQIAVGRM